MTALGLIMPIVAAGSFAIALLVPLRDARRGERATLRGRTPIQPSFQTNEQARPHGTNASPIDRLCRALDAIGGTFVAVLGLRSRPAHTTTSDDSFERQLARIVLEPTMTDSLLPPIDDVGDCTSSDAASATEDAIPLEPAQADEKLYIDTPPSAESRRGGTLLACDLPPPLTRLRLRPDGGAITWPVHLPMPRLGTSETERRIILTDLEKTADAFHERALASAYREEGASGRMLVLRALSRISSPGAHAILTEALNLGSDDERALAVDLLSTAEHRESLVSALHDRVDAIAARAALAYVRSNRRSDYEMLLSTRLDERRLETILALLGGILE